MNLNELCVEWVAVIPCKLDALFGCFSYGVIVLV